MHTGNLALEGLKTIAAAALLFATGCSPKVYTSIQTTPSTPPADREILLWEQNDSVPAAAEVLGSVLVKETNSAHHYDYRRAVRYAKKATAAAAGNGLQIVKVDTISSDRGTYPQLTGKILHLPEALYASAAPENLALQQSRLMRIPGRLHGRGAQQQYRSVFFANVGYAFVLSDMQGPKGIGGDPRKGLDVNAGYQWTSRRGFGLGARYSGYYTSAEFKGLKLKARLHYIGPEFVMRQALSEQFSLNESIGAGYARYREGIKVDFEAVSGYGFHVNLGLEWKITSGLGLNLGAGLYSARFSSPGRWFVKATNGHFSITRLNLDGGLRVYF